MSVSVTALRPAALPSTIAGIRRALTIGVLAVLVATLPAGAVGAATGARRVAATTGTIGPVDPGIQPIVARRSGLTRVVYGYLPYWRLDSTIAGRLQYDLLSTVAFFGLGIKPDGNIDTRWRGYTAYLSDNAVAVTNAAHAAGVRVVPTFQLFDSSSLTKLNAFLNSTDAQDRFIGQALQLIARRSADGANIDFEPMPDTIAPAFIAFVDRFGTAMKARFPAAQLVVATSAGAGPILTAGLPDVVDYMFLMTYGYHSTTSSTSGPIAPLDNATRTVKLHVSRFLTRGVSPSKLLLGLGYYGYDWPVTSSVPYATVRTDRAAYGGAWSVTYASARDWLAAHPTTVRQADTVQGSAWYTYRVATYHTYRQVYFEDEGSLAAKDDYAIASDLGGVGIWTLGSDGAYPQLWNVLRAKFLSRGSPIQAEPTGP